MKELHITSTNRRSLRTSDLNTDEWEKWCPPIKRNIDGSCREEL